MSCQPDIIKKQRKAPKKTRKRYETKFDNMVANDIKISKRLKNKGQLTIETKIRKYGKINLLRR